LGQFGCANYEEDEFDFGSSDPNNQQDCGTKAGLVVTDNALWITNAPFPSLRGLLPSPTLYTDGIQ
jgi:hypothetical protein